MDILRAPWIPSDIGTATPVGVLEKASRVEWGRGDWNMATFCLLHAMIQSAVVLDAGRCPNRRGWEALRHGPPAGLDSWFDWKLGEHPWECMTAVGLVPVGRLLPETPGDNAIRKCSDIARWHQDVPESLSLAEAGIAVISDNLWGTRIGTGYYQGARGEQSLMTIVEPAARNATLWDRVWMNVLPADEWARQQDIGCGVPFDFPWNQAIPTAPLTPENTHPLGILWQMPRRWRIEQDSDGRVRNVHRANKGRDYSGWEKLHPLTPYFAKADGTWTAAKVGAHTGFKDWAGIALQGRKNTRQATVVTAYLNMAWDQEPLRLRCCGWALADAGAPGGWIDHVVPFYVKAAPQADVIDAAVMDAESQRSRLYNALEKAKRGLGVQASKLYIRAEKQFYGRVSRDEWGDDRADWKKDLRRAARDIYWSVVDDHRVEPLRAVQAATRL